jgi:DNA-binding transcriptional LysR family regulator
VRITAPTGLAEHQFAAVIANVARRHPGLSLELHLSNRFVDLVAEGIDLAIRAGHLPDSSLVARKITDSTLGVFAAPSYLERRGRPRTPDDLTEHDCLCYRGRDGKLPWRLTGPGGRKTVAIKGPLVSDDMLFLRDAAIQGMGIVHIPMEVCRAQLESGALVRVLPRYGAPGGGIFLVWPSQKLVPARVVAAREALFEELVQIYG